MAASQNLPTSSKASVNGTPRNQALLKTPDHPTNYLTPLGEKIFLDRYAWKDGSKKSLAVGDTVIVCVDEKTRQREIAMVEELDRTEGKAVVRLRDDTSQVVAIEHIDKPFETTPAETMARIAKGIAAVEVEEKREEWEAKFNWLLEDWKFVPGGRIWAGAGTDQQLTFYNCMPPEQEVLTDNGYKPIGDVQVGDWVVTHKNRLRQVLHKFERETEELIYNIRAEGLTTETLRLTGEHKIHAICAVDYVDGRTESQWIPAEQLEVGDFVSAVRVAEEIKAYSLEAAGDTFDPLPLRFEQDGLFWASITSITTESYQGTVLDIEVDEDHSFISAGLVVSNCYVVPSPRDSRGGIVETLKQMMEIMSRGGGVGINVSSLRPRYSYVKGVNGRSSGAVSWGGLYSFVTGLIEQGGCLTPDTLVQTEKGLLRLDELVTHTEKGWRDHSITMMTDEGPRKSRSVYNNGVVDILEVKTENGFIIKGTPNHKLKIKLRNGTTVWKQLSELRVGDAILSGSGIYTGGSEYMELFPEMELTEELAESWGQYLRVGVVPPDWVDENLPYELRVSPRPIVEAFAESFIGESAVTLPNPTLAQQLGVLLVGLGYQVRLVESSIEAERVYVRVGAEYGEELNQQKFYVASVTPAGQSLTLDLEVDENHTYIANGLVTHNSRRGALMLICNDWHPDVMEFINSKREAGKITNANISVGVSDGFMKAVKEDGDWDLVFPDTSHPAYDKEWDGNLEGWRAQDRPVIRYKTVKARDMWHQIIESAWASAEPGLWFRERSNTMSNSWYYNPLISTNPCVTGDTLVYTGKGLRRAEDLYNEGTAVDVVLDGRFGHQPTTSTASHVFRTGYKTVYRLQTREGYYVRATADHRIMTARGWVEMQDLQPNDKVQILNRKGGFGTEGNLELGQVLGWLVGDGTIKQDEAVLSFFGEEKQELAAVFAQNVTQIVEPLTAKANRSYPVGVGIVKDRDEARVGSTRLRTVAAEHGLTEDKFTVPDGVFAGSEGMQRGFLQALFTADGSFQDGGEKGASVRLASNHAQLLEGVQQLLLNFGIASRIYRNRRDAGYRKLPDGHGGLKEYWCEAQHELAISKQNMVRFADDIGFLMTYKQAKLTDYVTRGKRGPYQEPFTATVESITEEGVEAVYDLTEPVTHSFIANGITVHNCGEQPLPAFGICNLGAVNLAKFVKDGAVEWESLGQTVRYATRFLDDVIDATPYFFEENKFQQGRERRVGLGVMGLAEMMIRLGLRYGSDEGNAFLHELFKFFASEAYKASAENAAEKGSFAAFDADKFLQSGFMQGMPEDVRQIVREKGARNVTLLTVAPTGTTGTMVNTSTGVEPYYFWSYFRKSRLGVHEEVVDVVQEWREANPDAELPDYFVTAMDLSPEDHVRVQAAVQRWIDSSISKTCNVPNDYTVEQTAELYELMYELGCKGGTIYRDGSRDEQVLNLKKEDKKEEPAAPKVEIAPKEPLKLGDVVPQELSPNYTNRGDHKSKRPRRMKGATYFVHSPVGKAFVTVNRNQNEEPFEVFANVGKVGSEGAAMSEALGRLISLVLRIPSNISTNERLEMVVEQLEGIGGARSVGFGVNRVSSLPDALAQVLREDLEAHRDQEVAILLGESHPEPQQLELLAVTAQADLCPECGHASFIRIEGCKKCVSCGHAEC